jgi:hypothetical protein
MTEFYNDPVYIKMCEKASKFINDKPEYQNGDFVYANEWVL